ncbi:MAG: hypothetical protein FWD82_04570 [Defluviitaleaceae bacterium]|nr:hypothetical protein [Defluviitaleaceae bacterium]
MGKNKSPKTDNLHKILKSLLNILKIIKAYRKEVRRALCFRLRKWLCQFAKGKPLERGFAKQNY